MRILLLGRDGQVGWELHRSLQVVGDVVALGRDQCDLMSPASVRAAVEKAAPDVLVNAAAYTAVDRAETEAEVARLVNCEAPALMAELMRARQGMLVHYSTDYVFDGAKNRAYTEDDRPNPLSVYGSTKLAGEEAVTGVGGQHLVFRTTWVYGPRGRNFMLTVLRLAREREELTIVNDQHGAPTSARLVADATAQALMQAQAEREAGRFMSGLFHLSAAGTTTWFGFACAIVDAARAAGESMTVKRIVPITTDAYPLPARRPFNSCFDCRRFQIRFRLNLPEWRAGLALSVESIGAQR